MVCVIEEYEKPKLDNPILIEGLPGIGFVANIAALHLVRQLEAKRFAEIHSSAFQDLAIITETGATRYPTNELYYHMNTSGGRDLIIWHGNTQALTTFGQYELCGCVLEKAEELGCRFIVTLGGFRQEEVKSPRQVYSAATDTETMNQVLALGTKIMVGEIFGIAGILVGLQRLRGFKGFSLLVDTLGASPDAEATRSALAVLSKFVNMGIDLSRVDEAAEETKKTLQSFGLFRGIAQEKKREEQQLRWFI